MPTLPPIKKNDQVYVLSGKDRGKTGRVLIVKPADGKIVVEGIQMIKRHTRANPQRNVKGGIVEKEAPLYVSKVKLICPKCATATRFSLTQTGEGKKVRVCLKCKELIDG